MDSVYDVGRWVVRGFPVLLIVVGVLLLVHACTRSLCEIHRVLARWATRHPGVPYRQRWVHLRTDCTHDDPKAIAWVRRCDAVGISPNARVAALLKAEAQMERSTHEG